MKGRGPVRRAEMGGVRCAKGEVWRKDRVRVMKERAKRVPCERVSS